MGFAFKGACVEHGGAIGMLSSTFPPRWVYLSAPLVQPVRLPPRSRGPRFLLPGQPLRWRGRNPPQDTDPSREFVPKSPVVRGVNNEPDVLRQTGCYAEFTLLCFPAPWLDAQGEQH